MSGGREGGARWPQHAPRLRGNRVVPRKRRWWQVPCTGRGMASRKLLLGFVAVSLCTAIACGDEVDAPPRMSTPMGGEAESPPPPGENPLPEEESDAMAPDDSGARDASTSDADAGGDAGIPKMPLLKAGLHPDASDALRYIGVTAGQITQTIGNAAASAGTHAQDGTAEGKPYSCATDISVSGKNEAQIKTFLGQLGAVGFAAWYRKPGSDGWPADEAPHIHAIWAGAKMKLSLRDQTRAWLAGRNGLVSNTTYQFYQWPQASKDLVRKRFLSVNPATN